MTQSVILSDEIAKDLSVGGHEQSLERDKHIK